MARAGYARAWISCLVIAAALAVGTLYAFSGAGLLRRLPLLRTVLIVLASVLVLRGLLFVPLVVWHPHALSWLCDCQRADGFLLATSLLCLVLGMGYAIGAYSLLRARHWRVD